ncbi:MAG: hypothetical protein ACYSYV_03340 [Planctomycetota bacterium]|jgi:hypothetical protein
MSENQTGPNELLDTTDCLEAVGVFKGWKNFFFVIIVVCLLLLQACFFVVDRGCIEVGGPVCGDESAAAGQVAAPVLEITTDIEAAPDVELLEDEPAEEVAVEPNEPVAPDEPIEADEPVEPNEPAEPNSALWQTEPTPKAAAQKLQRAIGWPPADFLSGVTFEQLTLVIRLVNAVLILTTTLYCLTLLFGLKVSMNGRLGGINHISRAFFLSLFMLILLLPWQRIFGCVVTGAVYTPCELVKWYSAKTDDIFDVVLYYLRFSGYGVLILLLLLFSQFRSLRWAKAILRRLEII